MSQETLAAKTGLDRAFLSGIERGVENPSLFTIQAITDGLSVSLGQLTRGRIAFPENPIAGQIIEFSGREFIIPAEYPSFWQFIRFSVGKFVYPSSYPIFFQKNGFPAKTTDKPPSHSLQKI